MLQYHNIAFLMQVYGTAVSNGLLTEEDSLLSFRASTCYFETSFFFFGTSPGSNYEMSTLNKDATVVFLLIRLVSVINGCFCPLLFSPLLYIPKDDVVQFL